MKIQCYREKLLNGFQLAATVAAAKSPKDILQNIKLEVRDDKATLMATDQETGIRIEVEGIEIVSAGKVLLPVTRMGSILRESSDESLSIESLEQTTVVRGLHSEFNLPSTNPDEFPTIASFEEEVYHEIPARLFKEMLRRTVFATDPDSSRYALGGVLLELSNQEVMAVGTDGRRMAQMEGKGKSIGGHATTGNSTIIPTRAIVLMERTIGDKEEVVHVAARANDVLVRTSRSTIYTRLVEGRYPNWRQVIPKREKSVTIQLTVGPFFNAIRQAAIVADQETRGLDFQFGEGNLVLSAKTADYGQSRVEFPISYEGESIKMKLDYRFVSDFLKVLEMEKSFSLEIAGHKEAAVFRTDDGYTYVVMPMAVE